MTTIELRTIVEAALRKFGCDFDAVEENLLLVAVPADSPVRQILDVEDVAYLALVPYDEDRLAGLDPVRHLIRGSIYLERFIGILTEHGAVGDLTLPAAYDRPGHTTVRSFVAEAVPDATGCEVASDEPATHRCVTFHFVVDLIAIESSKSLVSVTFDFDGRRLVGNPEVVALRDVSPAVVEIAGAELKAAAGPVLESVRAEVCRRIEAYAEEHLGERSAARKRLRRQARTYLGGAEDDAGRGRDELLEEERAEIVRDWEQRIRHADSQYRAEGAQITLVSATRQLRPLARYEIHLPGRATEAGDWAVFYDLTCGNFLLPACRSCGAAVQRLTVGDVPCSHPLCERCAEVRAACGHRACRACVHKCGSCAATVCGDCGSRCAGDDCASWLCEKHETLCAKCEACACARHRQFCRSCQRTFCTRCYADHQWKQADCGHLLDCGEKLRACRVCSKTLCVFCNERCKQCGRYSCKEHTAHCWDCSEGLCDRHKAACFKCAAVTCSEHRQACGNCHQTFCNRCSYYHGRTRADCGHMIVCGSKPGMCSVCKISLCFTCAEPCQRCKRTVCHEHMGQCLGCRQQVCERCAGMGCETCGAKCCKEHSFPCKVCGLHLCYEHVQWCAVCGRAMCEGHALWCRRCFNTLCPRHGRCGIEDVDFVTDCAVCEGESELTLLPCARCHEQLPRKLLTRPDGTDQLLCIGCSSKCPECATWSSEFAFVKCAACGTILCEECLEKHIGLCA